MRVRSHHEAIEKARAALRPAEAAAVLDIGGGDGAITEAVAKGCPRIVVLEPNPKKRARGSSRRPQIEFLDGRAEGLPFSDGSFTCVLSVGAFHHFSDQRMALQEIRRVLQAEGRLVLIEHDPTGGRGRWEARFAPGVARRRPNYLQAMLAREGFVSIEISRVSPGYLVQALRP